MTRQGTQEQELPSLPLCKALLWPDVGNKRKKHTYAFSDRQIRSYDLCGVNKKYIAYV